MKKSSTVLNTFHQPRKLTLAKPRRVVNAKPRVPAVTHPKVLEKARTIARHYLCFKKPFKADKTNVIPLRNLEASRYFNLFIDIAKNIIEYEKTSKVKVNIKYYVLAHFCAYGAETYPGKLKAVNSFSMYKNFREQASFKVSKGTKKNAQEEQETLLNYLSEVREESPLHTLKVLSKSGLFTDKFIMEKMHGAR